jgi:hypothetical protein
MIFLLGGGKNPLVRAVVGVILLVVGITIHGGAILIALGAVLIVWGTALTLKKQHIDSEGRMTGNGRMS